jgi:Flp pilus assembly protein TadD
MQHCGAGRPAAALPLLERVLALDPDNPDALNNLGVVLRALGKPETAAACYRRALAVAPDRGSYYSNLGNVYRDLGRYDEAAECHRRAISLAPRSAECFYNLGLVLHDLGALDEAIACYDRALGLRPDHVDCRWDRALALLRRGDYARGFAEYEVRHQLPRVPRRDFAEPAWDGGRFDGRTLLVHHEQGFGDTIQFIRFAPLARARGGRVVVECQPELVRLLATADGIDEVVAAGSPLPPFDLRTPLTSLPHLLGTTLETLPAKVPYLHPPDGAVVAMPAPPDARLKIGIAWAGRPNHGKDRLRSCPLSHFLGLIGPPGIAFYSLQKGEPAADLRRLAARGLIHDLGEGLGDFADTAAAVAQLDLVISVDTAVAHLAGALGKPVWALLHLAGEWRWPAGRQDSPWYPTMRLFAQRRAGDWNEVFVKVRDALTQVARSKLPAAPAR